jgi:prepilin-type N-terminal cleavage/methylation domain-containing protein
MLDKIQRTLSNQKAFTLIEVIICLVLVGIMTAIAGMGLIQVAEGYVFAKQNAETAQKAQVAIARIVKELGAATVITPANQGESTVTYTRPQGTGTVTNSIAFSDPVVKITTDRTGSPPGETALIDDVQIFHLDYCNGTNVADNACVTPDDAAPVRRIVITLTVSGQEFKSNVFMTEFL